MLFIACDKDMSVAPNNTEKDTNEGDAKELYFTTSTENLVATEGVCILKDSNGVFFKRNFIYCVFGKISHKCSPHPPPTHTKKDALKT